MGRELTDEDEKYIQFSRVGGWEVKWCNILIENL